jgi:hypothetical protein
MALNPHINYFRSYESLSETHENRLTRAMLLIMRMVPLAHQEFLRRAAPQRSIADFRDAEFDTQRGMGSVHPEFLSEAASDVDGALELQVLSIFMTPDQNDVAINVSATDREPIYDGLIRYGDDLVIVIEAKLNEGVEPKQANEIALGELEPYCDLLEGQAVKWYDLFESWLRLLEHGEHGLLSYAERNLLDDFFVFIEESASEGRSYEHLLPFTTLRRAGTSQHRVHLRVRSLLAEATALEPSWQRDGHWSVGSPDWKTLLRVALSRHDAELGVAMWPGFQQGQAKRLHGDPGVGSRLASLSEGPSGATWLVEPNLVLKRFRGEGLYLHYPDTVDLADYLDFWSRNIGAVRRRDAPEVLELFDWLNGEGMVYESDRSKVIGTFVEPGRSMIDVCPSLAIHASWDWETATRLDDDGQLSPALTQAINAALRALGEETLVGPTE